MNAIISIIIGVLAAMAAWAFFKSVIGAIFFGLILMGLVHWFRSRD